MGFCVQLYSLAETPQVPPSPRRWGSYTRALLVSQDRRHLFVTPLRLPNLRGPRPRSDPAVFILRKAGRWRHLITPTVRNVSWAEPNSLFACDPTVTLDVTPSFPGGGGMGGVFCRLCFVIYSRTWRIEATFFPLFQTAGSK
jgi:hypothetical protein